jgi:hypothetical protein
MPVIQIDQPTGDLTEEEVQQALDSATADLVQAVKVSSDVDLTFDNGGNFQGTYSGVPVFSGSIQMRPDLVRVVVQVEDIAADKAGQIESLLRDRLKAAFPDAGGAAQGPSSPPPAPAVPPPPPRRRHPMPAMQPPREQVGTSSAPSSAKTWLVVGGVAVGLLFTGVIAAVSHAGGRR